MEATNNNSQIKTSNLNSTKIDNCNSEDKSKDDVVQEALKYLPTQINAQIIAQGAEGRTWKCKFLGRDAVMKERFGKKYRHPLMEKKLIHSRLLQEARCLMKASKLGIQVPAIYFVDTVLNRIYMEYIDGQTIKSLLWSNPSTQAQEYVMDKMGQLIAILHDNDIIHGDMTTSNFMSKNSNNSIVVIDFGLSYNSILAEDKAVDLYVLEKAFLSTHPTSELLFSQLLASYSKSSSKSCTVIPKLNQVRLRGRKKIAFG